MGKTPQKWNKSIFDKRIKDGRGQGKGKEYKPWITIQSFASQGLSLRGLGWKTDRLHHFLSKNEIRYFYLLEWADEVVDIREQFPLLKIDVAKDIALDIGIQYPVDNESKFPYVLTTDFFITVLRGGKYSNIARSIKPAQELDRPSVLEKLEIERRYWVSQDVDWGIVTEKEISRTLAQNIGWFHSDYRLEQIKDIPVSTVFSLFFTY